jgi:hypothetical protein
VLHARCLSGKPQPARQVEQVLVAQSCASLHMQSPARRTFCIKVHGHNESTCTVLSRVEAPPLQARRLASATKAKRSAAGQERKRRCFLFRRLRQVLV